MNRITHRLAWYLRDASHRLGLFGAVGMALLGACVLFYAIAVLPLASESAALQREIAEIDQARDAQRAGTRTEAASPAEQLAQFYRFFPGRDQAADRVAVLYSIAAGHGVLLDQGTYRMVPDRGGKLWRYEVTLPVKGDYPQLRKFLSQALAEMPHLALDRVSFQRQKAGDATLEAQIKLTFFFGEVP